MPNLTDEQKKKRGRILQDMADIYRERHQYLTQREAYKAFADWVEHDPVMLRCINALAASTA